MRNESENYWQEWARRRISRRRALGLLGATGAAIAAGPLLAACQTSSPAAPSKSDTGSTAGKPVSGGTFIMIQSRDITSLDPLASQVYTTPERIGLVCPRLLYLNRDANADFADVKAVPSYITEKWEFSPDNKKLTFRLRKGVKYSKTPPVNGRELVAADVKFSINRYMTDPTSAFKARYNDIDSIDTPDDYTVVFNLKRPSAYVMYALAAEPSFITPPEVAQQNGDYKQVLVGPGPFIHEKTTQGEGSSYRKNPDFIDADKIYYDRFEIKVITDVSTLVAAIRTGQADFSPNTTLTKSDLDAALKGNTGITSFKNVVNGSRGFWFNMNNPKWKDVRARKAISKAINRQAMIDQLYEADGTFTGPVPVGFGKYALQDKDMREADAYKYDPAAAKKLWAEAGMPATSTIDYLIPPKQVTPILSIVAEKIGQDLKTNLGIESNYSTDEYNTVVNKMYNNKFTDVGYGFMSMFDALDILLSQYYPEGPRNGPRTNDPKLTKMLDEAKGLLDDDARAKKMLEAQRYINEEVLSMLHVPQPITYSIYSTKLRNFLPAVRPPGIEWILNSWKVK